MYWCDVVCEYFGLGYVGVYMVVCCGCWCENVKREYEGLKDGDGDDWVGEGGF